ncbi:MAG: hypothetical protein IJS45_06670 [Clostridia bacterium]|nr:hypothetical protein [Clostridia bacterium]
MTVTDFYPVFYAEDFEAEIKRFDEVFGFSVKHRPEIELLDYAVLENGNKRRVDIVRSHYPADSFKNGLLGMRVNVDDYDEGVSYFRTQGYTVFGTFHDTESSTVALLTNGSGSYLILFQHRR